MSNAIAVTGANGWLGFALTHILVNGLPERPELKDAVGEGQISCFVLPNDDAARLEKLGSRVKVVRGDVRNSGSCDELMSGMKGGTLFHTAGIIHPGKTSEFTEVNVEGTINVINAAIKAGVRRAVIVSSNSPCGCNPHPDHVFDESSPYHPYMGYGLSKMRMELAVKDLCQKAGIEYVIVRPPWFYGPFQPPRQSLFFTMIKDGKGPIVGSGNNLRSMSYVDNLSQGLILAASVPGAAGKTYWVADEKPYSMNEIIDTIERLLEKEFNYKVAHKRMRLPSIASEVALVVDWSLQKAGMYNQKIHVLSEMNKTIACSVDLAKRELGYKPTVALEEGMRRSIRWCLDNGIVI